MTERLSILSHLKLYGKESIIQVCRDNRLFCIGLRANRSIHRKASHATGWTTKWNCAGTVPTYRGRHSRRITRVRMDSTCDGSKRVTTGLSRFHPPGVWIRGALGDFQGGWQYWRGWLTSGRSFISLQFNNFSISFPAMIYMDSLIE